jgi:DNA polymerase-3 subunit chi
MAIRADFYMIAGKPAFVAQPLLLVCKLAEKAVQTGQPCLIFCESSAQADFLDDLLWEFDDDAFIPHQIVGLEDDEDQADTPVLIVPPGVETGMRPLVINLRHTLPANGYQRVLEIVPADDSAREPARQRWLEYKKLGHELKRNEM